MSGEEFLENLPLVRSTGKPSKIQIRGIELGGTIPVVIAGPCAIESEAQIIEIAQAVKKAGAVGLRGGVFKPRSSPYSFQGLGEAGLAYLAAAREKTGLFTVVEVTAVEQLEIVSDYVDLLQIGARNMQNFELLKAAGRSGKPVLLKRGLSATIQELLQAAEYILCEGNSGVILCERGIRTFETLTRNTLDINAIPLLKKLTHLPVFADPSHGTGRRDLVVPVAKAAIAAGADGLLVEVHSDPGIAVSDGQQTLDFHDFKGLMISLTKNGKINQSSLLTSRRLTLNFEKFAEFAAANYQYIPVGMELVIDAETPVTAFAKLAVGPGRFLLESVERGEQVGRFSFIGWEPLAKLQAYGSKITIETPEKVEKVLEGEPLAALQELLTSLQIAPSLPQLKFFAGAVGYLSYDYVRTIEKLPEKNQIKLEIPDVYWMIPRLIACFDHVSHKLTLILLAQVDQQALKESYQKANEELAQIALGIGKNLNLEPLNNLDNYEKVPQETSMSEKEYLNGVNQIKDYIVAGDAFQVVLAQRITQKFEGDPFNFYRMLRTINPSPYLFYLDFGDFQLAGSSPEVMVKLEEEEAILKPLAGTRPRGATPKQDQDLREELLADEKERAEHVMLVDLGRNDLGRVCRFGSVKVQELMQVENYSHVMHIVSKISGELRPDYTGIDLLRAVFPAGTLTGAPKVRAMEIIEEIEPVRRGFYGGAIGYLGIDGNLDTCITIRTVLFHENQAILQAGAGIVADSVPENEYQESQNKACALLKALEYAGGMKDADRD